MKQITEHFALYEFSCRDEARTPYPEKWIDTRLLCLCQRLELIRYEFGDKPLTVLSGYRTPEYNRKIGGARASQHIEGRAADIVIAGVPPEELHAKILALYNAGDLRIGGLGSYETFTHLDIRPGDRLARWVGSRLAN